MKKKLKKYFIYLTDFEYLWETHSKLLQRIVSYVSRTFCDMVFRKTTITVERWVPGEIQGVASENV